VEVSLERNVCFDAWWLEEGPLSPHLAVVETCYNPESLEGLDILGVYHFEAWARRIDEIVMDLNYGMGPCGTVGCCGAVTVTKGSKLSYINEDDKRKQAEGSRANMLYVRPIAIAEIMTPEVIHSPAVYSDRVYRKGFSTSGRRASVETYPD
jgi:hypothetical protein